MKPMDAAKMKFELIPIFEDNYVFVLFDEGSSKAIVVDPGEPTAVAAYLRNKALSLDTILLTHHHPDHIGGAKALKEEFASRVVAPLKNKAQIPFADEYVQGSEIVKIDGLEFSVLATPGHTLGHISYWHAPKKWLFCGDVLFGLGCGRLFEGTPEQMYQSLQLIKELPQETLIFCAHEYTEANLEFCKMLSNYDDSPIIGGDEALELYENELNGKRGLNLPSVPLKLFIETKVNPFLLAKDLRQFTNLRDLRNRL